MPKKKAYKQNGLNCCPSNSCLGGNANRQKLLTEGQFALLKNEDRTELNANRNSTYRCNYCGCVYIRTSDPKTPIDCLGFLDNAVLGEGWYPIS